MTKKLYRLAAILLFMTVLLCSMAEAVAKLPALTSSKYIQTYPEKASGKIYAYTDETLKKQKKSSWIDCTNDECYIIAIKGNAAKVSYPLNKGGRNVEWFKRSDFSSTNLAGNLKYETFFKRVNTYRHSNGKVKYGYAENKDKVYVLGTSGAYTQIVYPLTNGKWKMGWAKTTEVNAALKVPISSCTITGPANATYTGKAVTPSITVKYNSKTLINGTDYTLSWSNNVNAGTNAKVTVTAKGNYTGSVTKTFSIINPKVSISSCTITGPANATYTGKAVTPAVTVKYGSTTLANGTDYTLSWSNNVNAGTNAKVTIAGKGKYTGSVTKTFSIVKKETNVATTTMYVVTSGTNLNVRQKGNSSAKILGQLANGTAVSVYSVSNGWAKIKYSNGTGYVSSEYLSKTKPTFNPVWPCASKSAYKVTCLYYYQSGSRHRTQYDYTHGMDIAGGGNIRAVEKGTVETVAQLGAGSFGNYIVIRHANGAQSLYAHLASFAKGIKKGASVTRGQTIGVMGDSGKGGKNGDMGVHLHFEMSNTDPWKTYYKDIEKISFEKNVRSNNNAKKATDKSSEYIVKWIDKYYERSGSYYVRKPPASAASAASTSSDFQLVVSTGFTPTIVGGTPESQAPGSNMFISSALDVTQGPLLR